MQTVARLAGVFLTLLGSVVGVADEGGRVAIESLRTRDLETLGAKNGPQNFAIAEDARGVLYLANNLGIIELDGRSARLIPLPGRVSPLSFALDRRGRLWVGAVGDLGYLEADAKGAMTFVSLLAHIPKSDREFGDLWQTSVTSAGVYFRSPTHLFRWDGKAMRVWKTPQGFHMGAVVGDRLIVRQIGVGLSTIDGDTLHLLPGGERFADERVYVILPYGDGRVLLVGRTVGAMLFDPTGRRPMEKLVTEADDFFGEQQVYHGCVLSDGAFAITSVRGGVAVIDRAGHLLARLDKQRGLNDDMVFFAFASSDHRLWLGLNYGVSVVDWPAAITRHPNEGETGLEGFVESIARHQGALYAATGRGVYRMLPSARAGEEPRFVAIPGTATQCYSLVSAGDTLLAATRDGIVAIRDDKLAPISPDFAYEMQPMRNPDRALVAFDQGAGVLEKSASGWRVLVRNDQAGHVGVGIVDAGNREIWAGTESDGLYRLRLDEPAKTLNLVQRFDAKSGLPEGWIYPHLLGARLVFGTREGIYRFDASRNRFELDPEFMDTIGNRSAFRVEPDGATALWVVSDNEVLHLVRTTSGWKEMPSALRHVGGGDRILSFLFEDDVMWVGGDHGLFRYVKSRDVAPPPPRALIREARLGDGAIVFAGASGPRTRAIAPIPHANNTIRFAFAGAGRSDLETSYRLDGFDSGWSAWSREPWKEYTNLPGGAYTFRVRARDRYAQLGPESALAFSVLEPWYLTWWALAAFAIAAALLIVLLVRARGAHLRRRNVELQRIIEAKTAELREASYTDPLTSLRNRRYFAEAMGTNGERAVLLLVDLDSFKAINDRLGHAAGDAVLVETARRLASVTRESDLLFRWGGEEFLLIARGLDVSQGDAVAQQILHAIGSKPFVAANETITLTTSVGWAPFTNRMDIERVLDLADQALYRAKADGKNRAVGATSISGERF